ncbi:MAG TPA: putative lipid II flippase FtsW [Gemmatimonadota bacterium]|nr:putative lipid II flippase FtsW [Gemmatimonadota bacterium]
MPAKARRREARGAPLGRVAARRAPEHGPVDRQIRLLAYLMVGFGLVMVYSASSVLSLVHFGQSTVYFTEQLAKAAIGIAVMLALSRLDYRWWERLSKPFLWGSMALLAVLVVPGMEAWTIESGGARRWLALPGVTFQPLELAKLALVVWMAATLARQGARLDRASDGLVPLLVVPGIMGLLLVLQPDFKGAVLLLAIAWSMLLLGGVRIRHLAAVAAAAVPVGVVVLVAEPYRLRRLTAFVDPGEDLQGVSYQIHQSLISLGSGGWFGVGLGSSKQKFAFLPAAHNDFIFAIVGEELGILGSLAVLGAFLVFGWLGFRIARRAPDGFGFLLASGVTLLVLLSAVVNIGVATAVLPTTGLTLPFISYGGTSLIVQLAGVGILLSVSRDAVEEIPRRRERRGWRPRLRKAPAGGS